TATVWDTRTGNEIAVLPERAVIGASLAPSGERVLATRHSDASLLSFDVATQAIRETGLSGKATFDVSGHLPALMGQTPGVWSVRISDASTLSPLYELNPPPMPLFYAVDDVRFMPNVDRILVASGRITWIYDTSGKLMATVEGETALAGDGRHLIVHGR